MSPKTETLMRWLKPIEIDLAMINNSLTGSSPTAEGGAYHCQQATEKMIKALLIFHEIDFPHTHNLAKLLNLLPANDVLYLQLVELKYLTTYGFAFRYDEVYEDISAPSLSEIGKVETKLLTIYTILLNRFSLLT